MFASQTKSQAITAGTFLIPKKGGGLRRIMDLCGLNLRTYKFKMLTIKTIVSQIQSENWFVTITLKDAYFHIEILPQHTKFLRFAFEGRAYQYRVLQFGLALSPCTYTKCIDATMAPLRLQGIHIRSSSGIKSLRVLLKCLYREFDCRLF